MMDNESSIEVSIVFPAYNEADNIAEVLREFSEELTDIHCEFIVVNDGSDDKTADVLEGLTIENLKVIHHTENQGYGAALYSGFSAASGKWTFFTDSDRQFKPQDFHRLWSARFDCDVVLGYRVNRMDPTFRKLNAWLWSTYVRLVFDVSVQDLNCAFKLFPSDALKRLDLHSKGAFINAEILSGLHMQGLQWCEVPVNHYPRTEGVQTGAHPRVVFKAFQESLSHLNHRTNHHKR